MFIFKLKERLMFKSTNGKELKKDYIKQAENLAERYIAAHEQEMRDQARQMGLSEDKIQKALEITKQKSREEAKSIFIKEIEKLRLEETSNNKPSATN
jgi:hypothetical protein